MAKDDALFQSLRGGKASSDPPKLKTKPKSAPPVTLSTARTRYIADHKRGEDVRFIRDVNRAIDLVISTVGDLPLQSFTRDHAREIRDKLILGHSTATVRRRLNSISAVFNIGRREFNIQCLNPFEKMAIPREGQDAEKRIPFSLTELRTISVACYEADDDIRHIIAMQLSTGARLGELVGLRKEDVSLDPPIPFIYIRPHEKLGHSLKTPGSERVVPLLHSAYWGAHQALLSPITSGWLFPRYASDGSVRATHASNTVNKYISETLHIPKTSHSFRHSMKDLLRESGCPDPIQRQLLGHGAKSSQMYGQGYSLTVLRDHLRQALALLDPLDDFIPSGDSMQALPPPEGKGRLPR